MSAAITLTTSGDYVLWVNDDRTVLVRLWVNGTMETAHRDEPGDVWGPPTLLRQDAVR